MKTKNSYFSKALVILLAIMIVFTMMPSGMWGAETAWAAEGDETSQTVQSVRVYLTSQVEGAFLHAPKEVEVSADLAESYGFKDDLSQEQGVSALDVLVKAHQEVFGDEFKPETVKTYLSGTGSWITTAFGAYKNLSFAINGECPNDGVWNEAYKAYTGYSLNQAEVKTGDDVEFFIYQDEFCLDNYGILTVGNGDSIYTNDEISLNVQGYSYAYLGCSKQEDISKGTKPIEGAQVAIVNAETGAMTVVPGAITDQDGNAKFAISEPGEYLLTAYVTKEDIEDEYATPLIMRLVKVVVKAMPNTKITVPQDAELTLARKGMDKVNDYFSYNFVEKAFIVNNDDNTKTYYFDELENGKTYYYRASGEEYVTYASYFTYKTANGFSLSISKEMLQPEGKDKKTIDHDTASNNKQNVADVYLNINEKGHLNLKSGAEYQIVNIRNWQIIDGYMNNNHIEPDYNYTVLNLDGSEDLSDTVLSINRQGVISAKGKGTKIVLVTYDAITVPVAGGGPFFGAIWPENTGVFVVSVDADDCNIETNMVINSDENDTASKLSGDNLDAEMDVIYFTGNEGEYTFKPITEGCTVSVANPVVDDKMSFDGFKNVHINKDSSFTVPLTNGRNIVKIEKDGKATYQIITAKSFSYTINNGEEVKPGDKIEIVFDTIYNPANKLATIYNGYSGIVYKTYDGKVAGNLPSGFAGIYTIANDYQTVKSYIERQRGIQTVKVTGDIEIPADYEFDTYVLTSGKVAALQNQWSCEFGKHREISREKGSATPNKAGVRDAVFGQLPDIEIPIVATTAELDSISLTTTDVKTTYYEGDAFDTTNLVVTATYEDGATQTATNYTVTPEVLTTDTKEVTITYRGKTAKIPVSVQAVNLTEIKVEAQPTKTTYTVGDVFNPNGIKITAKYDNESTKDITSKVTYSNTVFNTAGDAITVKVTYTEKGITKETILNVKVNPAQGGTTPTDTISVTFTLLGDSHHGEPTEATGTHTLKANNLETWIKKTTYTLPKGSNVVDLLEKALGTAGIPYTNPSGNYVDTIRGLGQLDNGKDSGWMFTYNGKHGNLGVAEQKLNNGDVIVFHYTDAWQSESDTMDWATGGVTEEVKNVTSDTKTGTTTAPTEVKVTEKVNADGTKTKVAEVKVSADNQKEILKQAKANKSKEIILSVATKAVGDATKADVTLDKSFIDSIVKDTDAKLTVKTPFGDKTYTQDELKAMSEAATGTTVTVAIEKAAEQPADDTDKAAKIAKAKSITAGMKLTARSSKTAKKNVKVVLKSDAKENASLQELKDLGFTVKYRFFRSTNKSASYKSALTKKTTTYTNTSGKKGTKYFYKVQVRVYDENGKLVATTALRQCKYATRTWSK